MIGKEDEPQKPTPTWVRLKDDDLPNRGWRPCVRGKVQWVPAQMPDSPIDINVGYLNSLIQWFGLSGLHLKQLPPPSTRVSIPSGSRRSGEALSSTAGVSVTSEKRQKFKKRSGKYPQEVYIDFENIQIRAKNHEEFARLLDKELREILFKLILSQRMDVGELEQIGGFASLFTLACFIVVGVAMVRENGFVNQDFLIGAIIIYSMFSSVFKFVEEDPEPQPLYPLEKVIFKAINPLTDLQFLWLGALAAVLFTPRRKIFRAALTEE